MYIRFARRAEGVRSSRTVFSKARKERWTPWEVYESAGMLNLSISIIVIHYFLALMEYHGSDDKEVAGRVFEKGLEMYGDEIDFVQRYLGFLISINDQKSALAISLLAYSVAEPSVFHL